MFNCDNCPADKWFRPNLVIRSNGHKNRIISFACPNFSRTSSIGFRAGISLRRVLWQIVRDTFFYWQVSNSTKEIWENPFGSIACRTDSGYFNFSSNKPGALGHSSSRRSWPNGLCVAWCISKLSHLSRLSQRECRVILLHFIILFRMKMRISTSLNRIGRQTCK